MEKRFGVLRIIGTLWKILAWIILVGGILFSGAILLVGILGSGGFMMRMFGQEPGMVPGAFGIVSSVASFIIALVATIIYFLILYAVGDLIYLLLAIEENTRQTKHLMEGSFDAGSGRPASPPPSPQTGSGMQS